MNMRVTSIFFILLAMLLADAARAWDIDWSRRQNKTNQTGAPDPAVTAAAALPNSNDAMTINGTAPTTAPAPTVQVNSMNAVAAPGIPDSGNDMAPPPMNKKYLDGLVQQSSRTNYSGDRQEFVILNTGHGFVPSNVRIHKGLHYLVHIVNVNEDKKNVSFMLDAFNQHYATYFGQIKTFNLDPDKEGVFDFQCPETNSAGKLIVFGQGMAPTRIPSSQK